MRPGLAMTIGAVLWSYFGVSGCATAPQAQSRSSTPSPQSTSIRATPSLIIARVGVEPKTLDLRTHGMVTIHYHLTHPASVHIDLVDEEGKVIRQLDAGAQPAGPYAVTWNGQTEKGEPASNGVYRYILHADGSDGQRALFDPSSEYLGEELQPRDFVFDKETGFLRWVMPKAGRVRLRLGLEGFPHLRTLLDWEPLEAGQQEVFWDGKDESGLIQFKDHPHLSVKLHAFAIPNNTIIVRGNPSSIPFVLSLSPPEIRTDPLRQDSWRMAEKDTSYLHARHPRSICHEVNFQIFFPDKTLRDAQGRFILKGIVPVRMVLDDADALHVVNQRFEVVLFEDLTFLSEDEEGLNPFNYLWDTTHLTPGEHLLTVNILSYDDHYGVKTEHVMIEKPV